jgi:hypothetical protein
MIEKYYLLIYGKIIIELGGASKKVFVHLYNSTPSLHKNSMKAISKNLFEAQISNTIQNFSYGIKMMY